MHHHLKPTVSLSYYTVIDCWQVHWTYILSFMFIHYPHSTNERGKLCRPYITKVTFNIACYCSRVFRLVIEISISKVKELIRIKHEIFMIMRGLMSCTTLYSHQVLCKTGLGFQTCAYKIKNTALNIHVYMPCIFKD